MTRTIVVGVDGSDGSVTALRWAVEEAERVDARVEAVIAWTYPYVATVPGVVSPVFAVDDVEADARALLDDAVDRALEGRGTEVTIDRRVEAGPAARALIERSAEADLLVVGTRGHGGFVGLLLGSVSEQCAHHAKCPVVIVPPPGDDDDE